ncbi:MAG TPA: extracellular solute-binding protein [Candidatus Limnocylindria bacterium]|jgi:iron(III) transport system substrate-binding protein|nr:extracellular solute-binding protein [Candidatus Limnocylindria bacterium]
MGHATLRVYSGRNRPDLTPIYRLFESLTDTKVEVEMIYHLDVERRLIHERSDPRADVLVTNSQVAVEAVRGAGIFEPYRAEVARAYDEWLRAPDYTWLSFTAWPRTAMINRRVLNDPASWPSGLEELTEERFRGKVSIATTNEETTVSQISSIRAAKGDDYAWDLIDRLLANGLRTYESNKATREALIRDRNAVALVNSSNYHVFLMEGNPVGEAWLDQDEGGLGTHVEAHVVALVKDAPNREAGEAFVDFLLAPDTQSLLARMFGETPVNPSAVTGMVRPLAHIRRTPVSLAKITGLRDSTRAYLTKKGFAPPARD